MGKFHSTVNRRDFMKGIGLAGVGLGGAYALSVPTYQDTDEAMTANPSVKRPWYVHERDYHNPTVDTDWSLMRRHNVRTTMWYYGSFGSYIGGPDKVLEVVNKGKAIAAEDLKTGKPGCDLLSTSLGTTAGLYNNVQSYHLWAGTKQGWGGGKSFTGQTTVQTPEQKGVPKWEGSPEENMRILRAALRFYGAPAFGVCEYNGDIKDKLTQVYDGGSASMNMSYIDSNTPIKTYDSRPYMFEDADWGYETQDKIVIPDKKKYWLVTIVQPMSRHMWRQGQGSLRTAANGARYSLQSVWQTKIQGFLRGIGYEGLGYPSRAFGPVPAQAGAILDGMAEIARNNNVVISPEYGSTAGYFSILTDLPLEPTRPIDAGMWRFCQTCNICASNCPSGAIVDGGEPSWEITPPKLAPNMDPQYSSPGKKTYWNDTVSCRIYLFESGRSCGRCMGTCVFNTDNSSSIHQFVKGTLATTGLFNEFLWRADKAFGFGLTSEEEWGKWWDMSLPAYGFDTTLGATDGGFRPPF